MLNKQFLKVYDLTSEICYLYEVKTDLENQGFRGFSYYLFSRTCGFEILRICFDLGGVSRLISNIR